MSEQIQDRLNKYINHKTNILVERVQLAIIDKIFDAENNDKFEIDNENNIYIIYSLKKDEYILSDANEIVSEQVIKKYRKKLEEKLEDKGYYVEYEDSDINVYFSEPLKVEDTSANGYFLNKSLPTDIIVANIDFSDDKNVDFRTHRSDSNIFNFDNSDDQDK
jgi:hypothetical protein